MNRVIQGISAKIITNLITDTDSSSDSDEEIEELILLKRKLHRKIENYVERTVPHYDLSDFRSHFRMSKASVEQLCSEIAIPTIQIQGRPRTKMLDSVLLTLWSLANQESFRGIGDRFGMNKGHAHTIFRTICKLICSSLQSTYIVWPTGYQLRKTVQDFTNLRDENTFPNVMGCVDGTHIQIVGTFGDNSFYNRKGFHSMILQGICNSHLEFIDVFAGWPGSSHDARVWQNSPIYNKILNENVIPEEYHLLGDTAYPLRNFIMVPFKDNGHLTQRQKKFNKCLSSKRVVIEQAFGRLRGIFRRLKFLHLYRKENFKYVVLTACILHNFIIQRKEFENEIFEVEHHEGDNVQHEFHHGDIVGRAKRERIMLNL